MGLKWAPRRGQSAGPLLRAAVSPGPTCARWGQKIMRDNDGKSGSLKGRDFVTCVPASLPATVWWPFGLVAWPKRFFANKPTRAAQKFLLKNSACMHEWIKRLPKPQNAAPA
jgi:hypothetical protein